MFCRRKNHPAIVKKIAICGASHHTGVTTYAIALTNYLCNKLRRKGTYLEFNGTHEISSLLPSEQDYFRYRGMDFYADVTFSKLSTIYQDVYDYYVLDMGVLNSNTIREFVQCDLCIVLGHICAWNMDNYGRVLQQLDHYYKMNPDQFRFLGFLGIKENVTAFCKRYHYPIQSFPYISNPFQLSSSDWHLFQNLVNWN